MSSGTELNPADIDSFAAGLHGSLIRPDDPATTRRGRSTTR